MAVICKDVKKITDETMIDRIGEQYKINFTDAFKLFFKENNGGIPIKNIFEVDGKEYEIRCFLSFNDNEYNSIIKPLAFFLKETHGKIVPIAKDSSDCYYCLNMETGKIYFWDKEDNLYYAIAGSLSEFIACLTMGDDDNV